MSLIYCYDKQLFHSRRSRTFTLIFPLDNNYSCDKQLLFIICSCPFYHSPSHKLGPRGSVVIMICGIQFHVASILWTSTRGDYDSYGASNLLAALAKCMQWIQWTDRFCSMQCPVTHCLNRFCQSLAMLLVPSLLTCSELCNIKWRC